MIAQFADMLRVGRKFLFCNRHKSLAVGRTFDNYARSIINPRTGFNIVAHCHAAYCPVSAKVYYRIQVGALESEPVAVGEYMCTEFAVDESSGAVAGMASVMSQQVALLKVTLST